jgi:hypothetical protein
LQKESDVPARTRLFSNFPSFSKFDHCTMAQAIANPSGFTKMVKNTAKTSKLKRVSEKKKIHLLEKDAMNFVSRQS